LEASQSWGTIPEHFAEMVLATLKVKLNYKAILQTPDQQLHDMFDTDFKH
jgi:hypothetical protein